MKIERIAMHHITMPLASPFETSFGRQYDRESIIVAMYGERMVGWGECVATNDPGYSYETAVTAWHVLSKFLIPAVLGKDLDEPETIQEWMKSVRGHPMAKAALDQAAWDLLAKRDNLSFAQKLAQPYAEGPRKRVEVGVSIGIQPSEYETIDLIEEYYMAGYRRFKLKIKPGHDLALVQKVREFYPDERIMLDANSAYTLDDVPLFQAMDDLNLLMLEQPLGYEDVYDHSLLHPQIKSPLCLDESITS
ncbi:MAG: o-succinylbenzoate synthase, partial [Anaerolineales bacterium]|nr:o-succinylbenzoate synthase [Anaerolineales bacterium]